jgi:hypothetical protein
MDPVTIPSPARRVLAGLLPALLGQGDFAPGRPNGQKALASLGESLCRWLDHNPWIVLIGGNPIDPLPCAVAGFAEEIFDPALVVGEGVREECRLHLAGFWKDRRLALICLRRGLTTAEFDHLYHLLSSYAGKGLKLRSRLFEEQARGHLPSVSLVFLDDLPEVAHPLSWPVRVSLAWLHRDLNMLSRSRNLSTSSQLDWREQVLSTSQEMPRLTGKLDEFFANLDLIAEEIDNYNKDELVFSLLEQLDEQLPGELCLKLCTRLDNLTPEDIDEADLTPELKRQRTAIKWIARRLIEQMLEEQQAGPEHLHALVLHKVLLYEEIPQQMRSRVASLQVLTSFLANPQKYFAEVENSHSPEVLETRLWRILEMLPKLIEALRFDAARDVLNFAKRFGPSFDLLNKPEIMTTLMDAVAGVLTEAQKEHQTALMQSLPQMGRAGAHLLIELADHRNRSVRRVAFDALLKIGQPVVPILFETLEVKQGWHYLRNMLLLLAQLNADGPEVENLFRRSLTHPEANVRKEALSGIARLLRHDAARLVADSLGDQDFEVKKRAAACLGLTGIADEGVSLRLARILSFRDCGEDLAVQIVASLNRLKADPPEDPALETALINMLGAGGFMGLGGKKASSSKTLRVSVVQALGLIGGNRTQKALSKMSAGQDPAIASAVADALEKLASRSA